MHLPALLLFALLAVVCFADGRADATQAAARAVVTTPEPFEATVTLCDAEPAATTGSLLQIKQHVGLTRQNLRGHKSRVTPTLPLPPVPEPDKLVRVLHKVPEKKECKQVTLTILRKSKPALAVAETDMWALAAERFAAEPFSNGGDKRYEEVKAELRKRFGKGAINDANKPRLKQLARLRGRAPEKKSIIFYDYVKPGLFGGDRHREKRIDEISNILYLKNERTLTIYFHGNNAKNSWVFRDSQDGLEQIINALLEHGLVGYQIKTEAANATSVYNSSDTEMGKNVQEVMAAIQKRKDEIRARDVHGSDASSNATTAGTEPSAEERERESGSNNDAANATAASAPSLSDDGGSDSEPAQDAPSNATS